MFSKLFKNKTNKSISKVPDLMASDPNQVSSKELQITNQSAFPQDITSNLAVKAPEPNNLIINSAPTTPMSTTDTPQTTTKDIPIDLMSSSEPIKVTPPPVAKAAPIPKKICSRCGGQNIHTNTNCVHCKAPLK